MSRSSENPECAPPVAKKLFFRNFDCFCKNYLLKSRASDTKQRTCEHICKKLKICWFWPKISKFCDISGFLSWKTKLSESFDDGDPNTWFSRLVLFFTNPSFKMHSGDRWSPSEQFSWIREFSNFWWNWKMELHWSTQSAPSVAEIVRFGFYGQNRINNVLMSCRLGL